MRFSGLAELFTLLVATAQPNGGLSSDAAAMPPPPAITRSVEALAGAAAVPNSNRSSRAQARLVRLSRLPCRTGYQLAAFVDEPFARSGAYAQRCSAHAGISDFN